MLDTPEPREEELLRRLAAGDEAAFHAVYLRHQGPLYRFALHMTGRPEIAEEAVQEAFLTLFRRPARFDPSRGTLGAFLLGVARNQVRRRLASDGRYVAMDEERFDAASAPAQQERAGENLARAEMVAEVRRAVLALPELYREVVTLCDLEGLSYAESAAALDCPVGTVRSRLSRAREMLLEKIRAGRSATKRAAGAARAR